MSEFSLYDTSFSSINTQPKCFDFDREQCSKNYRCIWVKNQGKCSRISPSMNAGDSWVGIDYITRVCDSKKNIVECAYEPLCNWNIYPGQCQERFPE